MLHKLGVRTAAAIVLAIVVGVALGAARAQSGGAKVVKAAATAPKLVSVGKAFDVVVAVTIDKPYHIQANPTKQEYIPTVVQVGSVKGFSAGKVAYPAAKQEKFGDEMLPIYEDKVEIKVPVTAQKSLKPGKYKLPVTVSYQACDEKNCFPPAKITTEATVTVGGAAAPRKNSMAKKR